MNKIFMTKRRNDGKIVVCSELTRARGKMKSVVTAVAAATVAAVAAPNVEAAEIVDSAGQVVSTYFHTNDGTGTQSTGNSDTNLGNITDSAGATGNFSVTAGVNATATNTSSVAIGHSVTSKGYGSITIGDSSTSSSTKVEWVASNGTVEKTFTSSGVFYTKITTTKNGNQVTVTREVYKNVPEAKITKDATGKITNIDVTGLTPETFANANSTTTTGATGAGSIAMGADTINTTSAISKLALVNRAPITSRNANKTSDKLTSNSNYGEIVTLPKGAAPSVQAPTASGDAAIAIGAKTTAQGDGSIALGALATALPEYSIAIGTGAITRSFLDPYSKGLQAVQSIAIGYLATSENQGSVSLGTNAKALHDQALALGAATYASGFNSAAIGNNNKATGYGAFVIGGDDAGKKDVASNKIEGANTEYASLFYNPVLGEVVVNAYASVNSTAQTIPGITKNPNVYTVRAVDITEASTNPVETKYVINGTSVATNSPENTAFKRITGKNLTARELTPDEVKTLTDQGYTVLNKADFTVEELALKIYDPLGYVSGMVAQYKAQGKTDAEIEALKTELYKQTIAQSTTTVYSPYQEATSSGVGSIAFGLKTQATQDGAIAMGVASNAHAKESIAVGVGTVTTGERAVSVGSRSIASGERSIAIGTYSEAPDAAHGETRYDSPRALADDAVAIGTGAYVGLDVQGTKSVALGSGSIVTTGHGDIKENLLTGAWEGILRNYKHYDPNKEPGVNADGETDKQFTLGNTTTGGTTGTINKAYVGRIIYQNFAGQTAVGAVSVGYGDNEKRIQNVAAGEISPTSTDAINGSQLYMVAYELGKEVESSYFHVNRADKTQQVGDTNTNKGKLDDYAGARSNYAVTAGVNTRAVGIGSISMGHEALSGMTTAQYTEMAAIDSVLQSNITKRETAANQIIAADKTLNYVAEQRAKLNEAIKLYNEDITAITGTIGNTTNADELARLNAQLNKMIASRDLLEGQKPELDAMETAANDTKTKAVTDRDTAAGVITTKQQELADYLTANKKDYALAIGSQAIASGEKSIAIGKDNNASGNQSIAIGTGNIVSGDRSGAFGDPSIVAGAGSYTQGNDNAVGSQAKNVGAFGNNNQIGATATYDSNGKLQTADGLANESAVENSRVVGNNNYINTSNTYVLGSGVGVKDDGSLLDTVANSVYLGNDSTIKDSNVEITQTNAGSVKNFTKDGADGTTSTAGANGNVTTSNVANIVYGAFAGAVANGAVTVGSAGAERRIMNVAAGEISASSTDAINGSQLYFVAKQAATPFTVTANSNKDTDAKNLDKQYAGGDGKQVQLGQTFSITGAGNAATDAAGSNFERNTDTATAGDYSAKNVRTVVDDQGVQIQFAEKPEFKEVTAKDGAKVSKLSPTNITTTDGTSTTTIAPDSITVGDKAGNTDKPITISSTTTDGNTKNVIDGLTNNLPETKNATDDTTTKTQAAPNDATLNNNAATVGDVLNAGWNLQANGTAIDFVKPYDTVNIKGDGAIKVAGTNTDGATSTVTISVETTTLKDEKATGTDNTVTNGADGKIDAPADGDKNKLVTAENIANAINNSGFTLKSSAVENQGEKLTGTQTGDEVINPGDVIEMVAGKNMTVKQDQNGKITYATKDNVEFNTVKVGTTGTGTDTKKPVELKTENAKPATNNPDTNKPTTALDIKSTDGKPTQITGVGSVLNTQNVSTDPDGNKTGGNNPTDTKLVNLGNATTPLSEDTLNSAATVRDIANMGWVVKATDNAYSDVVKNANEVNFVGTNLAKVTGETDTNGVRTITVDVNAQKTVEAADTPVVYTDADGNKLVKGEDGKFYKPADLEGATYDKTANKYTKNNADVAPATTVIASMNDGDNIANNPKQLSNVKGNLAPTYNKGDNKIGDGTNSTVNGKPTTEIVDTPTKSATLAPVDASKVYNNAATVGDVLNAGWNLQGNGVAKDFVKPYDTVNFINGTGTTVDVTTDENGKVSNVKVNTLLAPTNLNGDVLVKGNDNNWYKASEITNGVPNNDATVQNAPTSVKVVNPTDNSTSNPTKLGNVASSLNMKQVSTNPTGSTANPVPSENKELLNLEGTTDAPVNKNAAATVGDLQNMGWVVRAQGNGYSDVVKNANEVEFRGEGIEVNGKTEEGKRVITIKPLAQVLTKLEAELVNNTGGIGTTEPSGKITIAPNNNAGGFATAGNVKDMINAAGWRVQENGTTKDLVKAGDKVNFVNGAGTTVSVTTATNGESSDVKVNIDTTTLINKDGKVVEPVTNAANFVKAIEDAKKELADAQTEEAKAEANRKLAEAEKAADTAGLNKVVTAQNVAEAINKSGFTLKTSANGGEKISGDDELINPGDKVEMVAGKNLTVKQEANGKVTYATKDEVNFKSVEVGNTEPTYKDKDGNELVKVGDDYYKKSDYDNATVGADGKKDLTNVAKATMDKAKSEAPVKLEQDEGVATKETTLKDDGTTETKTKDAPSALSVKDSLGENSQINGIASALDTKEVATKPLTVDADGNPVANKQTGKDTLVDLTAPTDAAEKAKWESSAVTVGDIANMGWIVSATGNGYNDTVKNANQVDFVGTGLATVTGETKGGIRTITVDVNAQNTVEAADTPVIYTDTDGNKLTKVDDKFYKVGDVTVINGKAYPKDSVEIGGKAYPKGSVEIDGQVYPEGSAKDNTTGKVMKDGQEVAAIEPVKESTAIDSGKVIASMNDGDNVANNPKTLANVKGTLSDTSSIKADGVDKDGNPVVKAADGKYYPFGTEMDPNTGNPKDSTIAAINDVTAAPITITNAAPITAEEAAKLANTAKNNAATVGDVLNAGWNLQGNGSAVDFVKPYDTVNFVDGAGTKVEVTTDGQVSNVKVNVDAGKVTTVTKADPTSTADAPKPAINTGKVAGPIETALKAANKTDDQIKEITDKLAALNAAKEALANNKDDAKKAELEAAVTAKTNELTTALGENSPVKVEDLAKLENKVATAQDIANAINNTGFTLKADKTDGDNLTADATLKANGELINPGDTVTMQAGKNMTVKQEADGKVTYATKDDVEFNTVQVGGKVDDQGNKLVKVGDNYYKETDLTTDGKPKENAQPVENANVKDAPSVVFSADKGIATKELDKNGNDKNPNTPATAPTALSVKDKDGKDSQINGIASALDTKEVETKPTGKEGAVGTDTLVDLTYPTLPENATDEEKEAHEAAKAKWESSAVTVGDIANMGWIVSASGNEYTDTVKNANKVEFKGENGISVTGKTTANGVREITVSLEKGEVIDVNEGTVKIDGKDTDVVKVGGEYFKKEDIDPTTGKPKEGTTALGNDVVGNNGKNVVNNGDKFVDGHSVAKAIQESGFTVGKETDTSSVDFNNSDEKVNPNDELRFADGKGTTVSTGTVKQIDPNGEVSTKTVVKVDIDQGDMDADGGKLIDKILDDAEKAVEEKQKIVKELAANSDNINDLIKAANDLKAAQDALAKLEEALDPDTAAAREKVTAAENALKQLSKEENPNVNDLIKAAKDVEDARNELTKAKDAAPNKVATVADVVEAVNKTGFNLKVSGNTLTGTAPVAGELINPSDTVEMIAGKNMTVKHDTDGKITYATADDVNFTSVQFGNKGPKIDAVDAKDDKGNPVKALNVNGAKITGVAKGDITKDSTDAVNGSQIYALTGGAETNVADVTVTNPKTGEKKVIKDVIVDKDGNPALVTYNVDEQGEYIQNSVISAINHMNTQGIKYFHTRDGSNRNTDDQQFNGEDSRATGKFSTAIGYQAHAKGDNAVAFGNKAVAGEDGVAIGHGAVASGKQSISIGTGNKVTGNHSGAIGAPNTIDADRSYALGNNNQVNAGQSDVFVVGNNVKNTTSNSVFLGSNSGYVAASETTAGAGALESQVTGGVFNAYAGGKASEVKGVVSVGNVNSDGTMETRRIQNVAPGLISEKSTDAINGSQLYSLVANQNAQIGDIYNKMDREHKGLRAGIAGAAALAGIPEVHVAGRSMIAASASAYKSENAVAVGYSRLSDNSKIKLKLTGSANSRGDVMGTVGVGYMW